MQTKSGATTEQSAKKAAANIHQQIWQEDMALAIIYCSSHYDLAELGPCLKSLFGDTPVIGCTTAGEIGPKGIQQKGIVGISIQADDFFVTTSLMSNLKDFRISEGIETCHALVSKLKETLPSIDEKDAFFLSLIDGVSKKEEHILTAVHNSGLDIPLVGGSAGDNIVFDKTYVYFDGEFHQDAALLALIHTDVPFTVIKENAYEDTGKQIIVTAVDDDNRTINEFNGDTAAQVYADIIGKNVNELDFAITSNNPVALKFGDELYIRTIIVKEGQTEFAELPYCCNVEEGMVLRVAKPLDTVSSFKQKIEDIKQEIGDISVILGFDCVCRRLIYEQHEILDEISELMQENNVLGFHTYGEQFLRTHINQTFTGIAFGKRI